MTNQAAQTMPERPEFSVDEALRIADQNADAYDKVASVSRTLAAEVRRLSALSQPAGVADGGLEAFTDYFVKNYPGPDTIIYDPRWHAPRIFRAAQLAIQDAAPAASGAHPDALPDGTLSKSTAKRLAAASVSERARELLATEYRTHGWHEEAGRLCMGGDPTSFVEDDALRVIDRLVEQGDEDAHVITELGRLLACIAVILKGPEPAGTAWSYHDLPELVASALSEPRQVAAEMKAWAHTKMAEQQSSRRDRMMVAEWAKRLLPESSFPVKDFDVEGMSITKEAAREAVKRVSLEQALTQQRIEVVGEPGARIEVLRRICKRGRDYFYERKDSRGIDLFEHMETEVGWLASSLAATPQPSADAVREYDRELIARMLLGPRVFSPESVAEQARLLREADNLEADARTVVRATDDHQQNAAQGGGEK